MKAIILPRAGGKTTKAVEWVAEGHQQLLAGEANYDRVLVCPHEATERYAKAMLVEQHGIDPRYAARLVTSAHAVRAGRMRDRRVGVYGIDNLDLSLPTLASVTLMSVDGVPVDLITLTG